MSEKGSEFEGKTLTDALNEEADEIEKRAQEQRPERHLTQADKDSMLQNIMDRLREKGEAEGAPDSNTAEEAGPEPRIKAFSGTARKPLWKRAAKCAGILLIAGGVVFATSLISEGNRMYWLQVWQNLFPGSDTAVTNNDEDRILSDVTEKEAREEIEETLNAPVPEFYYLPTGMKYEETLIMEEAGYARLEYSYNGKNIFLSITESMEDLSGSTIFQSAKNEIAEIQTPTGNVTAYLMEDSEREDGISGYHIQWIYNNCRYELNGIIEKEEIVKILEKIRYTV